MKKNKLQATKMVQLFSDLKHIDNFAINKS